MMRTISSENGPWRGNASSVAVGFVAPDRLRDPDGLFTALPISIAATGLAVGSLLGLAVVGLPVVRVTTASS